MESRRRLDLIMATRLLIPGILSGCVLVIPDLVATDTPTQYSYHSGIHIGNARSLACEFGASFVRLTAK